MVDDLRKYSTRQFLTCISVDRKYAILNGPYRLQHTFMHYIPHRVYVYAGEAGAQHSAKASINFSHQDSSKTYAKNCPGQSSEGGIGSQHPFPWFELGPAD